MFTLEHEAGTETEVGVSGTKVLYMFSNFRPTLEQVARV